MTEEQNAITNIAHVNNIQGLISQIYPELDQIMPHNPYQTTAIMDMREGLANLEKTDLFRLQQAVEYKNKKPAG